MIKKIKFISVVVFVFVFYNFCFADVIGTKDAADVYTYTLNSSDDVIITSSMTLTESYAIRLDTQIASGLIIKNYNQNENLWNNDISLSVNGDIEINKIYLLNEDLLTAINLKISSDSYVRTFADNLSVSNEVVNEGVIYIDGGKNINNIAASTGTVIFNISTTTISTNSANIQQYEVLSQGEFYNETAIKVNNYKNYGLTYNIGTIEVNDFANSGSFYTLADNVVLTGTYITNNGYFEITGGTNTYKIIGSSGTIVFGSYGNSVIGNTNEIQQSTMYVQGLFTNEGIINITENIVNFEGAEFKTDINNVSVANNSIINFGKLELKGNGINNNVIDGRYLNEEEVIVIKGTTTITGEIANNNLIVQDYIINEGTITTSFTNIYTGNKILNNGQIIVSGNSGYNENDIEGSGSLKISTHIINISSITQNKLEIDENVFFETSNNNFNITEGIINNGILYLTGGINTNEITGSSGTTVFVNISTETPSISTNSANIQQKVVESQGYFYNNANITAEDYENNGLAYSSGTITVSTFTNNGYFYSNANNITLVSTDIITNNGYFEITGGTNTYSIVGLSGIISFGSDENQLVGNINKIKQSTMYVQGIFTNEDSIEISQNIVNLTSGTLINKSTITCANIVFNYGSLTNEGNVETNNYYVNYGITTNNGKIKTVEIDNATGGTFETDINCIEVSSAVINFGELKLKGNGESNIHIVGQGTTTITGNITNNNSIEQDYIINEGTVTTKLELIMSNEILNNGKMTISENSEYSYNTNKFDGVGTLEILLSTITVNLADIKQNSMLISSSTVFYTKADLLDVANLKNDGALYFLENSEINKSTITGSGFLNISSDIESIGGIEQYAIVNQNNFTVDGSRFKANILINDGNLILSNGNIKFENTYLCGNGKITGDVIVSSSSTLSPGNSILSSENQIGTFRVTGNLTFDNSSTYAVEVSEDYNDCTKTAGNVTINSGSKVEIKNLYGKFFEHKIFDILSTESTLNGSFDEVNLLGYDVDVSSNSDLKESRISFSTQTVNNKIQVTLKRKKTEYSTSEQLMDLSASQKAIAQAIDLISLKSNEGQTAKLLSELESYYYYNSTYDIEKIKDIFTSLSGTIYANNAIAPFLNARYEHIYDKIYRTDIVKDYVDEYYVEGEEYYETKRNLWGEYFYNYYDVDGGKDYTGYTDSIDGFYAGYDISKSKNKLLGIVTGYAHGKLKQEYDKTETQSINLGAYGSYNNDKFQLKTLLMLGYDMYNTDRQTNAKSEYNGYNVAFDIQGSYYCKIKENFELNPFVGILTDFITQDSFSETNADSLNLSVKQNSNLLAQARIGVDVAGKIKLLNWYARLTVKQFLTQNYLDTTVKIKDTGTEFNLRGAELAATSFDIGFGGEYTLSQYWVAFANIQTGLGTGKSNNYYLNLGVKYKFGVINKEEDYIIR